MRGLDVRRKKRKQRKNSNYKYAEQRKVQLEILAWNIMSQEEKTAYMETHNGGGGGYYLIGSRGC